MNFGEWYEGKGIAGGILITLLIIAIIVIIILCSFILPALLVYVMSIIFDFTFKWIYVLALWLAVRIIRGDLLSISTK